MTDNYSFWIITPSYNQAEYIGKTIDSIQQQQLLGQHIIMDGKSTDNTKNVVKKRKHAKLSWSSKPDKGQTNAINKGLKALPKQQPNQVVAYLNSDDYYLPGTFARVAQAFEQHPDKQWLVGDAIIVDQDDNQIQQPIRLYKSIWRQFLSFFSLSILNPIPQPSVFIRRQAIEKVGPFDEKLYYVMDYQYLLRL